MQGAAHNVGYSFYAREDISEVEPEASRHIYLALSYPVSKAPASTVPRQGLYLSSHQLLFILLSTPSHWLTLNTFHSVFGCMLVG